jgi:Bacterial Ig-like domain (group 2)
MKRFTSLCAVAAGVWVTACGGNSPAAPTTPTAMSITPTTSVLVIGQTQPYSTANGPSTDVTTWSSTDPNVLAIDSTGNATAIAKGVVTITAVAATQSATLQVQVVPNYQGTWTGSTTNTACTSIGGFASYCAQGVGAGQAFALSLSQSGLTVSGALTKAEPGGVLSGAVNGSIGPGGDITLTGTLTGVSSGSNIVATLISWNSLAIGTTMTGLWATNVTSPQIVGIVTVQWSLNGVTLAQ